MPRIQLNFKTMQKTVTKKRLYGAAIAVLAGLCLTGCGQTKPDTLVVAAPIGSGFQSSIKRAIKDAGLELEVELVELPPQSMAAGDEAEQLQTQLRTELMAGEGPDLLLLDMSQNLFPDTVKAARSGVFCDLGPLLDETLAGMQLVQPVMDAGMIDGKRYLVPLGFDLEGIAARSSWLDGWQPSADTPAGMAQEFLEHSNGALALTETIFLHACPAPLFDTAAKTISLSPQQEEVLEYAVQIDGLPRANSGDDVSPYFLNNFLFDRVYDPQLAFFPIPNGEGGYTAQVSLAAAVRANSPLAEEAARIIAQLLKPQPPRSTGAPRTVGGYPMLPAGRDALDEYLHTDLKGKPIDDADSFLAIVDKIDAAYMWDAVQWEAEHKILGEVLRGTPPQDAFAALQQEYRYYFEE